MLPGSWSKVGALGCALTLALSAGAAAQAPNPFPPYNGHNPFNCVLQNTATGVDYPDPEADPLCVEYDKTQQNVTDFGLVTFLSLEPARTAAAVPKCFYYQHDHWTGSIVQGTEPEFWHWDGGYFFDKARGIGGVYVENFRIGGQAMDFQPYAPPEYQPYTAPGGGGGMMTVVEIVGDPRCQAMVDSRRERVAIYYHRVRAAKVKARAVGQIILGELRQRLIERVGPPHRERGQTLRWDAIGGGELATGFRGTALDRRVAAVLSTSRRSRVGGLAPGARVQVRRVRIRLGRTAVMAIRRGSGGARAYAGVRKGRVAWVALVDGRRIRGTRALRRTLRALSR
jgi:hypothetical protein